MKSMLPISLIPDVLPTPNRRTGEVEASAPSPPRSPIEGEKVVIVEGEEHPDAEASDMQQRLTLRELKEMCTQRSLSTAGKKGDLIARILEHDRSNSLPE